MYKTSKIILISFIFCVLFFVQSENVSSQTHPSITVDAEGEVMLAADLIIFQININIFKDSASEAFNQHKEQERFLTSLLKEEGIEEKNITAQPINISPRRHSNRTGVETRQQVNLTLNNISQFEEMQVTLIENGFDNFSSRFSAKNIDQAKQEALEKSVEDARNKAEVLASASGKKLGGILSIQYRSGSSSPPVMRTMEMAMDVSSESLLQFEHTLNVKERVNVVYELID